jgi:hypothetical protein
MKKILFAGFLFVCLLPHNGLSQSLSGTLPSSQRITILPPSTASEINCCVLPFNKIFVSRLTEVLWINESGSDIMLTIGKGTECKDIPVGSRAPYVVESIVTCHVMKPLPEGETRSVRFTNPGQHDYTIEYLGTVVRKPETGSVTVF